MVTFATVGLGRIIAVRITVSAVVPLVSNIVGRVLICRIRWVRAFTARALCENSYGPDRLTIRSGARDQLNLVRITVITWIELGKSKIPSICGPTTKLGFF